MSFVDGFGEWNSLGKMPVTSDWGLFPLPAINKSSSFRLSWSGKYLDSYSQVYLREVFYSEGYYLPSAEWLRIYPKAESELLFIPFKYPFHYQQEYRFFEAKKKVYRNGLDPAFFLKIEEFIPTQEAIKLSQNPINNVIDTAPITEEIKQTLITLLSQLSLDSQLSLNNSSNLSEIILSNTLTNQLAPLSTLTNQPTPSNNNLLGGL